jgi:hypothetical protein
VANVWAIPPVLSIPHRSGCAIVTSQSSNC